MRLMVFGNVGRGDKDGGFSHGAELAYGAGAASGNHNIGRSVCKVHSLDEVKVLYPFNVGMGRHELICLGLVVLAALPDYLNVFSAGAAVLNPVHHSPVESAAAKASSHYKEVFL